MRFSQAMEYGIVGLLELAKSGEELSLKEIAKRAKVPESFLAKIFQKLHHADIVASRRGKGGGFSFPKKNLTLSLWEIQDSIEGPTSLQKCVGESEESCGCHKMSHCALQGVWREAQDSLETVLRKWTIQDLLQSSQ